MAGCRPSHGASGPAVDTVSPVNLGGTGGAALDTGVGLYDVRDGRRDRATDGTHREDVGRHARSAQDPLDPVN